MTVRRRATALVLPVALAAGLTGCSLLEPSVQEDPPTAMETCALGHTWTLDVADLEGQLNAYLTKEGVPVTALDIQGEQTLDWALDSATTLSADYTLTVTAAPAADQVVVLTQKHSGVSTGRAYINGDVAIPRDWDASGLTVETTATQNGTALETVPYALPAIDIDDVVGVELTCNGGVLTTHARGSALTLGWSSN